MSKEAFIENLRNYIIEVGDIDKQAILTYLLEKYPSDNYIPEGFDKFEEMGKLLTLVEKIMSLDYQNDRLGEVTTKDYIKAVIYCTAIIEGRKNKIDIFKVKDDFEIDSLFTKYEI